MNESAVLQGSAGRRIGVLVVALLAGAALCSMVASDAGASRLVGKDGRVYACYRTKGKAKGAVRLVAKHKHCRKGEKKVSWSVTGPAGENGKGGENGESGVGENGGPGATLAGLEGRVQSLTSKVSSLEGILKGITNTELTAVLAKLQGISGAQLQEAVASVANVKALCTQASKLTTQANALGTALGGFSLNSVLTTLGGVLNVPTPPEALAPFGC